MSEDIKHIKYRRLLTEGDFLHVKFSKKRGKIIQFVLHYEALIDSKLCSIMRVDNAHDNLLPHKHTFHKNGRETKKFINKNPHLVFNEEQKFITKNFQKIKDNYLFSS